MGRGWGGRGVHEPPEPPSPGECDPVLQRGWPYPSAVEGPMRKDDPPRMISKSGIRIGGGGSVVGIAS